MGAEQQAVIDWLESAAGQEWSRAAFVPIAQVIGQTDRLDAVLGNVEPPEHEGDACDWRCHTSSKAFLYTAALTAGCLVGTVAGSVPV